MCLRFPREDAVDQGATSFLGWKIWPGFKKRDTIEGLKGEGVKNNLKQNIKNLSNGNDLPCNNLPCNNLHWKNLNGGNFRMNPKENLKGKKTP